MLPSMIQKDTCSNILRENSGIHKKLKIVFASSFKVYFELGGFLNFRYNISFIDPPHGGFDEILPSVMIFPSGQSPSGNIITSDNIPPNPPRSGSINDKYYKHIFHTLICNKNTL
jgi:hypothetical protein